MTAKIEARAPRVARPIRWRSFPDFSRGLTSEVVWTLPVITFIVYLGIQWWAFWYPGAEPGGGGYIAQRIFSARERARGAFLGAVVQHRALRAAPMAVDFNGAGSHRPLSRARSIRNRAT